MRISIFPTVGAQSVDALDVTWDDFVARCLNPPIYPSKAQCPLVKLASFGNLRTDKGALRHEANILSISGIEADYDAGQMSPEDAYAALTLNGIRALIYTSPSHTTAAPRWRILAPLGADAPVVTRREMVGRLNTVLGGILANESFTSAQSFYIGRVADVPYVAYATDGAYIDQLTHLTPQYPAKAAPIAPPPRPDQIDRIATPENIAELRSALKCIPAENYEEWTSVGIALAGLGDDGYALWAEWSATSDKHDPASDLAKWRTFSPDRTGFASVFSRAQRYGWINPKSALAPVDLTGVFAAIAAPVPPSPISVPHVPTAPHAPTAPQVIQISRITSAEDQVTLFAGCVYITNTRQMLVPEAPYLVDKARFDEMAAYAGRSYVMNPTNSGALEKSAWQAYLQSQILIWPRASGWCFRPERPPGEIICEEGETLVNLWQGIKTARTPGDATRFTEHLAKLLPDPNDYALLLAYLAAMVQYPGVKFQWCPVIQGAKGNGKSFLGACIEAALGSGYVHYPNSADITNKFTGWLQRKLAIIVEEISTHDKRETLEVLKPLITNRRIEMQAKGADQITGDNRANFLMMVNNKGAIPIDEDERRYAPFHTAQQRAEDIARDGMGETYFVELWNWARAGGFAVIAHYLATYPIPDAINPATRLHRAPRTTSFDEACGASLGNAEHEVLEAIHAAREGFCGGWVGGHKLDEFLKERGLDRYVTRNKRRDMMATLGYVTHAALLGGRTTNPIKGVLPAVKPVIYLRKDHAAHGLARPAEVLEAYLAAQRGSGLDGVFGS